MGIRRKSEPTVWTEQAMQDYLQCFRSAPRYLLRNLFVFGWESDLLFLSKSGTWTEIEIKISRSDFQADLKKTEKHFTLADKEKWMKPNRFFYAVPEGLVTPDEVPDYAGLIWVMDNGFHSIVIQKPAPELHKHKNTPEDLKLADKFYFNMMNAKRDALIAKNKLAEMEEFYDEGLHDGRRQGIQAALHLLKQSCPFRKDESGGNIYCAELDRTHNQICNRGLCHYLEEQEEKLENELKRLFEKNRKEKDWIILDK